MSVDTIAKGVLTANSTLSGLFTTPDGVPLQEGDRCLVVGQENPIYNGIYYVSAETWVWDTEQHLHPALGVRIYAGYNYKHSVWVLDTEVDIIAGQSAQPWILVSQRRAAVPGDRLGFDDEGKMNLSDTGVLPGTYHLATLSVDSDGRITRAEQSSVLQSFAEGLEVQYVGTQTLLVRAGAAYILGLSRIIERTQDVYFSLTFTPFTTYYIYLYESNGVGEIEFSTTPPGDPYIGNAKNMSGDDTKRYIGSFATDSNALISTGTVESLNTASTNQAGFIEIATEAEVLAAVDASRAVSPAGIASLNLVPIATILPYAADVVTLPNNWLFCDGSAVSRSNYQNLFTAIHTVYGAGNGSTTFNLPDLRGRVPMGWGQGAGLTDRILGQKVGAETHLLTAAQSGKRAHSHLVVATRQIDSTVGGGGGRLTTLNNPGLGNHNANTSDTGDANALEAHNNMQPTTTVGFIIRAL